MKLRLITTAEREVEVEIGSPVTAFARNEYVVKIQGLDGGPLTDEDKAWVATYIAPLMKPFGS